MKGFSICEEQRCGFRVTEKRKKIWSTQLELASEVKRICEKYNIKYFIIWGTLLGAVRHEGFIPWDDDFDIAFLRKDYERFCKVAKEEICEPFFLQTDLTDSEFFLGYARIRDTRTTGFIVYNDSPTYHNGIFVDLYPLDVIPKNRLLREIKFLLRDMMREICLSYTKKPPSKSIGLYLRNYIPYRVMLDLFKHVCMLGDGLKDQKIGLAYHPELFRTYHFDQCEVKNLVELPYENTSFAAPAGYRNILREVYGKNYMRFPPKRKRGEWHAGQIIYEPDISFKDFMRTRAEKNEAV